MSAASAIEHLFYLRNLMGSKRRYDAPPDTYAEGNVFFPLQYEAEASLLYSAPDMRNLPALVESIVRALPHGHVLWVKEHSNQFGPLTSEPWRSLRRRYHNLRYVFGRENGRQVIKACGLTVAITSQAGVDSMIFGRKTIVLGDVFYRRLPGSVPVRSIDALSHAQNDLANYGVGEYKQDIIAALTEFGRKCFPGDPQPAATLYEPENMPNIYEAMVAEVAAHAGRVVPQATK